MRKRKTWSTRFWKVVSSLNEGRTRKRARRKEEKEIRNFASVQKDQRGKWIREDKTWRKTLKATSGRYRSHENLYLKSRAIRETKRRWNESKREKNARKNGSYGGYSFERLGREGMTRRSDSPLMSTWKRKTLKHERGRREREIKMRKGKAKGVFESLG